MSQTATDHPYIPGPDDQPPSGNGHGDPLGDLLVDEVGADHQRLDDLEKQVRDYRVSRDSWTFLVFGVAVVLGLAALIVGLWAAGRESGTVAGPPGQTITASLNEFKITLSAAEVRRAARSPSAMPAPPPTPSAS